MLFILTHIYKPSIKSDTLAYLSFENADLFFKKYYLVISFIVSTVLNLLTDSLNSVFLLYISAYKLIL